MGGSVETKGRQSGRPEGRDPKPRRSATRRRAVLALAILVLAGGVGIGVGLGARAWLPASSQSWYDESAREGSYAGKTERQIQDDLNAQVAQGSMNISIASTIRVDAETATGVARIENIEANHYDQKVSIALKDTGEVLYESGAIAPGNAIDEVPLSRPLSAGSYPALVTFTGYDRDTHAVRGTLCAEVTMLVV